MAFFNLSAVFLALACATIIAEPVFRKEHQDDDAVVKISSHAVVSAGKSGKDMKPIAWSDTSIIVTKVSHGPPHKAVDTSEIYELINDHIPSMKEMPQITDAQLQSVGNASTSQVSASVNLTIGAEPKSMQLQITYSKNTTAPH